VTTAGAREVWLHGFPVPGRCGETAAQAERLGFDGLLLADSQNLVGDVFVELGVLARATRRLGLGTGVINPVTRHPAVIAAAIGSVLAMLLCASSGIFALRSVETPGAAGGSTTLTSVSSPGAALSTPSPAKNPNRVLDLLVTGLVVGAGTKPLHDLIGHLQTSASNSKASASSATATDSP
jgi:Luciferase-like monooxygenase